MTSVRVKYHMGIECLTGGWHETFSFEGVTVGELIPRLIDKHPPLKDCFKNEGGGGSSSRNFYPCEWQRDYVAAGDGDPCIRRR